MSLVVITSQNLSPGLRGAITKWMLEIGPGTFVGQLPTRVASQLWAQVVAWCDGEGSNRSAHATLVESADTEQGFRFDTVGWGRYEPVEFAGMWLVARSVGQLPKTDIANDDAQGQAEHRASDMSEAEWLAYAAVPP